MSKDKKAGGLAGVSAGETGICTVGKEGAGLTYRGYDIYDLAEHARFEEVAYLLHYGRLPTQAELNSLVRRASRRQTTGWWRGAGGRPTTMPKCPWRSISPATWE